MDSLTVMECPVCNSRHVPREEQKTGGVFAANCENCGHFFKYRAVPPFKTSISFTVNGVAYTAGNEFGPDTTLGDFLREKQISMGTKIMCRQGGCGICIVEAKIYLNPAQPKVSANLNSCLCPLFVCDGWEITTVEGLGSTKIGLHVIQKTLADYGGTQCGYCSPGHVMNMYGLTQKYPKMTKQFVEDHFEGNLCRCTGYRPILDAFKSLVPSTNGVDIEDMSTKMCANNPRKQCSGTGHCGGACQSASAVEPVRMVFDSIQWYKAVDYADLLRMLQQYSGKKIRLLGANTGTGAFYMTENVHNFEIVIDISGVAEFYVNTYDPHSKTFTLGANVTLSDMIELFTKQAATGTNKDAWNELKKYLYRVASSPVRNRATWSGNLMLKKHTPSFPSDIFNIMTVLKASLFIGSSPTSFVTPDAFFKTTMTGKALSKVTFGDIPANDVVVCFKVMPRSQNSLALVNAAFRCTVDPQNNFTVSGQPVISIGGISGIFHRATKTEAYLVGKQLSQQTTLTGAMAILALELVPSSDVSLPSVAYRKMVACALVYKFFLHVLGTTAGARYRSGSNVLHDTRPLSSGHQSYDTKKIDWPVNEPLKKLEADIQCTGEAMFTEDEPSLPGQLYASFVKSTQACATILNIDTTPIAGLNGVFKVLTASDIPGKNNAMPPDINSAPAQECLCSGSVQYFGQPLAVVLADTQALADEAAAMVKVTYTNAQTPIIGIDDAITKKAFLPEPKTKEIKVGDADEAIAMSPYVSSGSVYLGKQYHFHMETQCALAYPTDQGMRVIASTQRPFNTQNIVAQLCGIPENRVVAEVKRLGGGFGAKSFLNCWVSGICGMASYVTNRPVRMKLPLWTNMDMVGKRYSYKADYQVGHDGNGKLNGISVTYYAEHGYTRGLGGVLYPDMDNAYFCPAWKANTVHLKTNTPVNTYCRSPGTMPGMFIMEQMMEHVARTLSKDPIQVKQTNFYKQGQKTPNGEVLSNLNLEPVMNELMSTAQVNLRQKEFEYFNKNNRWKKKALAVVPIKWGVRGSFKHYSALVNIHMDGSVLVHQGGVEMGQGLNTKVAQVCAYELDIPVSMVTVLGTNTIVELNNSPSGGSTSSEVCCQATITACTNLKTRMAPVKAKMKNPTWIELVDKCMKEKVPLSEKAIHMPTAKGGPNDYNVYGATCSEVELDVLTGEYQLNRVDIVYDCGESLNPAVDIGQVEGGFIFATGYFTSEEIKYDPNTGRILSSDTWTYHPPTNKDIPVDFQISLLKNASNPKGVLHSKATGEPPLCMSCSVFFAIKKCIEEARKDAGDASYFEFHPPATVEKVQEACKVTTSQFLIQ